MIIDNMVNAAKYYCIHPLFAKAFEHIQSLNTDTLETGNYEIDGESLRAIVSDKPGKTVSESKAKFECHNKHIDIQLCLNGKEQIGWKPRQSCTQIKEDYNEGKDVAFYNDEPDMYFQLTNNQFAIFFPEDVHAPMIGEGNIKKMVIKVKI
ncbi:MAG: YhcH/YjgK/YiaL family protein [Ginsengibacter sp.]